LLAGAGQPGLDLPLAFVASYIAFCWLALRSPSWLRLVAVSAAWGAALLALVFVGTASWGAHVPTTLVAAGIMLYALPIGVWSRWAPRIFDRRWQLFAATVGFWGAWQELIDRFGLPLRGGALALTQFPDLLAGVRLVGTAVVEGLVLATCLCVAAALADPEARLRNRGALASAGAGLATLTLLALLAHGLAPAAGARVSIGIPQINVGRDYYDGRLVNQSAVRLFAERFDSLVAEIGDVDLIVTSETYDGRFGLLFASTRERWSAWGRDHRSSVLVTSFLVDDAGRRINAAAGLATGHWVGVHEKIDLAPFGETPLAAGTRRRPLGMSKAASVGVLICNEAMLQHPSRELVDAGANLLVATVNAVSFGSSVVTFGHLALARLRAIEVGRDIVWASNVGPSGVIDRWGHLSSPAPFRQPVAVRATAALHEEPTPLQRARSAPAIVCALVLLVLVNHRRRSGGARRHRVHPHGSGGSWRSVVLGATGIALCIVVVATSSALVEARRGDPRRAGLALQEALHGPTLVADRDPYARFRQAPTADLGAIAYFLEYFGSDVNAEALAADLEPHASLERVAAALEQRAGLRTRPLPVDPEALPRVAALTRLADGRLVVVNQPRAEATVSVFDAAAGRTMLLAPRDFISLGPADLLVPSPTDELDAPPLDGSPGEGR
jgi:apolipoprotein N-acyltransferase